MLRQTLSSIASRSFRRGRGGCSSLEGIGMRISSQRWMAAATSKQKRALSKQQLEGAKASSTTTKTTTTTGSPSAPVGGGSSSNNQMMIGLATIAVGGGMAYYFKDSIFPPSEEESSPQEVEGKEGKKVEEKQEEKVEEMNEEIPKEDTEEIAATTEMKEDSATAESKVDDDSSEGNRVVAIVVPPKDTLRPKPIEPTVLHPTDGHKVAMAPMKPPSSEGKIRKKTTSVEDNIKELQEAIELETSETIKKAHKALFDSFDTTLFQDLDNLSTTQLKARVVQLATEMKERTKWEAVRLKEFLAMKEKETADKYLDALQKQRIELEDLLAQRLREQEATLEKATKFALQEKDDSISKQVEAALDAQLKTFEEEKQILEGEKQNALEEKEQEVVDSMDKKYSNMMEEYKKMMSDKMTQRNEKLDLLSKQLKMLESALESSQNYQSGSLKAHRVSAAALALAEKLETNQGAGPELETLQMSVGEDSVIAAALSSIADKVKCGVPTFSELRARFDLVQRKTRQASLVPEGMVGLEGQLLGMLFSTLKFAPSPEDPIPENSNDKDLPDYLLVRAREYLELGDLEKAVDQLNKLKGQAAFTVNDWKQDAADRLEVDKALKVIRMEAALLNQDMSKPSE